MPGTIPLRPLLLLTACTTLWAADYRFTTEPDVPAPLRFGVLILPETGAEADRRAPVLTAGLATDAPFLKSSDTVTVRTSGLTRDQGAWTLDLRARVIGDQITLQISWIPTRGERIHLTRRYPIDPLRYTVVDDVLGSVVLQIRIGTYALGPNGALVPTTP